VHTNKIRPATTLTATSAASLKNWHPVVVIRRDGQHRGCGTMRRYGLQAFQPSGDHCGASHDPDRDVVRLLTREKASCRHPWPVNVLRISTPAIGDRCVSGEARSIHPRAGLVRGAQVALPLFRPMPRSDPTPSAVVANDGGDADFDAHLRGTQGVDCARRLMSRSAR